MAGSYDVGDYAYDVDVFEDYAYVSGDSSKIYILDITSKTTPVLATLVSSINYSIGLHVSDNLIYSTGSNYFNVVNFTAPSTSSLIARYPIVSFGASYDPYAITKSKPFVNGNYAYLNKANSGLAIIKVKMTDTDNDGTPDVNDTDDDNDGISDAYEITLGFDPLDASSTPQDNDNDGTPDALDTDDDNDGISDSDEATLGFNPLSASDGLADSDGDGFSNALEFSIGTNMNDTTDTPIWIPIIMGEIMTFVPTKAP